ncbi:MAG: hypothetical protein IPI63_05110 [Methanothrix sp.]|nr:hypothetical protein [Methanothrix sp.]MBK7386119.1 hypothetical protein [Methanothrix sp.]HPW73657.1 hypothetical protein [Methanothrix sp.]
MPPYCDPGGSQHRAAACCARRSSPGALWQRETDAAPFPASSSQAAW